MTAVATHRRGRRMYLPLPFPSSPSNPTPLRSSGNWRIDREPWGPGLGNSSPHQGTPLSGFPTNTPPPPLPPSPPPPKTKPKPKPKPATRICLVFPSCILTILPFRYISLIFHVSVSCVCMAYGLDWFAENAFGRLSCVPCPSCACMWLALAQLSPMRSMHSMPNPDNSVNKP